MSKLSEEDALGRNHQVFDETLGKAPGRGRMNGRRIVVVGAGQRDIGDVNPPIGNGRAIARLLAREGAHVACLDKSVAAAQSTSEQIVAEGGKAFPVVLDVSDPGAIADGVERCKVQMGGFDGLVLNVGITKGLRLQEQTPETWNEEFSVNLTSNMLFAKHALHEMPPGSSIVVVSSIGGLRASTMNPAYEASKAAQMALAKSIAAAGEAKAIRCNAVLPGLIDTPMGREEQQRRGPSRGAMVPFGRQGTGWEVAYACLFLICNESSYVNAQTLSVDGGLVAGISRPRA